MVISMDEMTGSRTLTMEPPTLTTKWVCEGVFSAQSVGELALSSTPPVASHPVAGWLYRQDIQVQEIGYCVHELTVPYAQRKRESGTYRFEFDTLGGTVHITAGTSVAVYPVGKPTHSGLIGVKGEGDVEGADIVIPAMKIIVHFQHPMGVITPTRIRLLSRLSGAVDTDGFFGWEPYETLFLGAQGSEGSDVATEIAYYFAMSENLTAVSIGGIAAVDKKGWDIAWIRWLPAVEGGMSAPKADYVNVVRVYKERSLKTILGFG